MTVYLPRSILAKMDRVKYQVIIDDDGGSMTESWPWQKFSAGMNANLEKDLICRVCAASACIPLLEKIDEYDVMGAIRSVANITITVDDALPKYICSNCLEILKIALSFKKSCEMSDRNFKKILNPMGNPSYHSYPYSKHDFQMILHRMNMKRQKVAEKKELERQKKEKINQKTNLVKDKQIKCSHCDIEFTCRAKLLAHRRESQCMKRACEQCGQLVLNVSAHMRQAHRTTAPHKCSVCAKEFPSIARMKNHLLVHSDVFNFFCDLCPYKCKNKYNLVMHMRTHTGEKPYKCRDCPATFVNPSNLNKHKRIHQEKQFKCLMCEKAFRTSSALREHQEAMHMNIKHSCNYCGREFCYRTDLRKHEIRNHNRAKRNYIGGEPLYKRLERLRAAEDISAQPGSADHTDNADHNDPINPVDPVDPNDPALDKWQDVSVQAFVDHNSQPIYFSDVTAIIQQPTMVQPQTVQIFTLNDLNLKKDDVKIYEAQQIEYF